MKIAMIGLRGIPSKDGGVETAITELAPALVKLGYDITVYARSQYTASGGRYLGVSIIRLPTINSKHLEAFVHTLISTIHAIRCKYDVIHYHADGNALFAWVPRIFKIKTVVTLHGQDWQRGKWSGVPN